jgi:simple sugar transport system permease protein
VIKRFFKRSEAPILIGVIAIFLLFSILDPSGWLKLRTLNNVFGYAAILGLIAIGEALLIICKEIDLSVGSVYAIVGIAFIALEPYVGVALSFIISFLFAALLGFINALLVLKAKLSSVIVTLGGLFFYRGVIYIYTKGTAPVFDAEAKEHWLTQFLGAKWLQIDNAILWTALILVLFTLRLTRVRFGNHLLAIGGDEQSARSRGVNIFWIKTLAFISCSTLAGLAAMFALSDSPRTHVTMGTDYELEAIAAAVIGGVALTGGRGTVLGAVLGTFFLSAVRYQIVSSGIVPPAWYMTFVGIILIIAVILNTSITRRITGANGKQANHLTGHADWSPFDKLRAG